MRKEMPWTLKEKKPYEKEAKKQNRVKKENSFSLIQDLFVSNKNKLFTVAQVAEKIGRGIPMTSTVIAQLKEKGEIKVVKMTEKGGNPIPSYQHKSGNKKELNIINLKCHRGMTTFPDFTKRNNVVNEIKFRYSVKASDLPKFIVKTNSGYAYGYREKDLRAALKEYKYVEEPRKVKKVQFKIFKWTITIE